jgi:hypothetical protein
MPSSSTSTRTGSQRFLLRSLKNQDSLNINSLRNDLSRHDWETLSSGMLINMNGNDIPVTLNSQKPVRASKSAMSRHFSQSNYFTHVPQDQSIRNAESSSTTMSQKKLDEVIRIVTPQIESWIEDYQGHLASQKEMLEVRRLNKLDIQDHESSLLEVSGEGLFAKEDIKLGTVIDGFFGMLIPSIHENDGLIKLIGGMYTYPVHMMDKQAFLLGHSPIKKANACFTEKGDGDNRRNNLEIFLAPVKLPQEKVNSPLRSPETFPGEVDVATAVPAPDSDKQAIGFSRGIPDESGRSSEPSVLGDSERHLCNKQDYFSSRVPGVIEMELPFAVTNRNIAKGEQLAYKYGNQEQFIIANRELIASKDQIQHSQKTPTRDEQMAAARRRALVANIFSAHTVSSTRR